MYSEGNVRILNFLNIPLQDIRLLTPTISPITFFVCEKRLSYLLLIPKK